MTHAQVVGDYQLLAELCLAALTALWAVTGIRYRRRRRHWQTHARLPTTHRTHVRLIHDQETNRP